MKILSVETSCDETAISLLEATDDFPDATYEILGDTLWSQVDIHKEYGGVFPMLAKREHVSIIVKMLEKCLSEADLLEESAQDLDAELEAEVRQILEREPGLADTLIDFTKKYDRVEIDLLAVTSGPGLEPALWVGVNFARALALLWDIKIVPVNHMEGHVLASIYDADRDNQLSVIDFPAISLLISGGHTELIHMKDWGSYEKIGQTRDDAVGEAFDKVARLMGLGYPGGPEISKQAALARKENLPPFADLPAPMLHSKDLDFSFSGLKTAVRYAVADKVSAEGREAALGHKELTEADIQALSRDFEEVVAKVLLKKTHAAIEQTGAQTVIVGGGVSANRYLKQQFDTYFHEHEPDLAVYFPQPGLSTDNSIMIALAGHARAEKWFAPRGASAIRADGNKSLAN